MLCSIKSERYDFTDVRRDHHRSERLHWYAGVRNHVIIGSKGNTVVRADVNSEATADLTIVLADSDDQQSTIS